MASPRLYRAYSVTTTVEKVEEGFTVFDTIRFGSSPEQRIPRFTGTEDDCLEYGEKLSDYWRRALENTPSLDA